LPAASRTVTEAPEIAAPFLLTTLSVYFCMCSPSYS
jgi:hypothetical protein